MKESSGPGFLQVGLTLAVAYLSYYVANAPAALSGTVSGPVTNLVLQHVPRLSRCAGAHFLHTRFLSLISSF